MSKLKDLVISFAVIIPLLILTSSSAEHSKKVIKGNLNPCDSIPTNTRGYVKGVVTDYQKDEYSYNYLTTIAEGKEGCPITIKHNNPLLRLHNTKVKALVKISSEGFAELINNEVYEDLNVVDQNGNVTPTEYADITIKETFVKEMKEYDYATWTINRFKEEQKSFSLSKEMIRKLKPDIKQRWYYQEGRGIPKVVDIKDI